MKQLLPFRKQVLATGRDAIVPPAPARSSTETFLPRRSPIAPSLRLRATAANRSLLRWMRAAELAAWKDADSSPRRAMKFFSE